MLVMPARPGTFIAHFTARGPPALKERLAADLSPVTRTVSPPSCVCSFEFYVSVSLFLPTAPSLSLVAWCSAPLAFFFPMGLFVSRIVW